MRGRAPGPEPVGAEIRRLLRAARPDGAARQRLARAFAIAAPDLVAVVRVRGRRAGKLILETASAAVLAELRGFRAAGLVARWPADPPQVPPITGLTVRLGG